MTTRRELLRDTASLALLLGLAPAEVWARSRNASAKADPLLVQISDLVIPATGTAGATAAGVPAFVQTAIELGLRDTTPAGLAAFHTALDARGGGSFLSLAPARATEVLAAVDQEVLGPQGPGSTPHAADDPLAFWRPLKALILMGYYSSEIGASQELQYELTPGHFSPDVPLSELPRGFSSDWTGVKYA